MHHTAFSVITVIMVSNSDHTLQHCEHSAAMQTKHHQLHNEPFRRTSFTVNKLFPKLVFAVSPFLNYIPPLITHALILVHSHSSPRQKKKPKPNPFISSFDPLSSLTPQVAWALLDSIDVRVSEIPVTHTTASSACEGTCWFPN